MAAFKQKLIIDQGATFIFVAFWKLGDSDATATPVDLTGCKARMHIRPDIDSSEILLDLNTENGRITLGGLTGRISLRVEAADTAAIQWASGVYDLEIIFPDGTVTRKLKGTVAVSKEVTRE